MRMEAHDKEGLLSETERKVRILRIGADGHVVGLAVECVLVGKGLNPVPHGRLESLFGQIVWRLEQDGKALEQLGLARIACREIEKTGIDGQVVPRGTDVAGNLDLEGTFRKSRFGTDAREVRCLDEGSEPLCDRVAGVIFKTEHGGLARRDSMRH